MERFEQLVKALRCENAQNVTGPDCAEYDCYANRGKGLYCQTAKLLSDAADAIEALQAEIRESMQRCAECGDELAQQLPKRGEIVRCGECKYRTELAPTKWHPCVDMAVNDDWFCADGEREVQE